MVGGSLKCHIEKISLLFSPNIDADAEEIQGGFLILITFLITYFPFKLFDYSSR
jgi:hypothetical protein